MRHWIIILQKRKGKKQKITIHSLNSKCEHLTINKNNNYK